MQLTLHDENSQNVKPLIKVHLRATNKLAFWTLVCPLF